MMMQPVCIIEVNDKLVGELSYRIKGDGAAYPRRRNIQCDIFYGINTSCL